MWLELPLTGHSPDFKKPFNLHTHPSAFGSLFFEWNRRIPIKNIWGVCGLYDHWSEFTLLGEPWG